jgi:hypothetical protein
MFDAFDSSLCAVLREGRSGDDVLTGLSERLSFASPPASGLRPTVRVRRPVAAPHSLRVHFWTCTVLDMKTYAVLVDGLGAPLVRIGPFIVRSNAERYATRLQERLDARDNAPTPDTGILVQVANSTQPHLDPRLPTEPWELAELIDKDQHDDFPNLQDRLCAQLGPDQAATVRAKAMSWRVYDWMGKALQAGPASRREQLLTAAEAWKDRRAKGSDVLQGIAVELWQDGLENVREIGAATGLSRTTVYAALKNAGIDPTQRATEQ